MKRPALLPSFRHLSGFAAVAGGFAVVVGLFFAEVPAGQREMLATLSGVLLTWGGRVINHLFPTTDGGGERPENRSDGHVDH